MVDRRDSYSKIAKEIATTPGAISVIIKKYRASGSVADKQRSGQPRKTTSHKDRFIVHSSLQDRRLSTARTKKKVLEDRHTYQTW